MPARSQRQRAWAFGNKGAAWARRHHFDNPGSLPKISSSKRRKVSRAQVGREQMIAQFLRKNRGR